jgi:hypothetical protein
VKIVAVLDRVEGMNESYLAEVTRYELEAVCDMEGKHSGLLRINDVVKLSGVFDCVNDILAARGQITKAADNIAAIAGLLRTVSGLLRTIDATVPEGGAK